jgi:hypothetical protein
MPMGDRRSAGTETGDPLLHRRARGGASLVEQQLVLKAPPVGGREGSARSAMEGTAPNSAYVSHIICYNCGKQGHFQADCKEEPFCVKCNKAGHVSAMCATLKNATEPFWAGYRVDGISFTCCEIQDEELPAPLRTQRSSSWSKGRSQ